MSVRDLQVRLTRTEDDISKRLGYREYLVKVGDITLDPLPYCDMKKVEDYKPSTLDLFKNNLQGNTSPIGFFELSISRTIDENLIRSFKYWKVIRDGIKSECLPVSIQVEDSRIKVVLAIVKKNKFNLEFSSVSINNKSLVAGDTMSVDISTNNPDSVIQITFNGGIRVEDVDGKLPSKVVTDGNGDANFQITIKSTVTATKEFTFTLSQPESTYDSGIITIN